MCTDCQHNTTGRFCEVCKKGFYRESGKSLKARDVCSPCGCEGPGVQPGKLDCIKVSDDFNMSRLPVVSYFGDADCGAGEMHTLWRSPHIASPQNFVRACVCISPTPQSPSPKLETTRSLNWYNKDKAPWSCTLHPERFGPNTFLSFSDAG